MWVDADDDQLLINTEIHRAKYKAIQQHPEVTVTIWDAANPYRYAEVRGRVAGEVRGDEARAHIDTLSQRYLGHDYRRTIQSERVVAARSRPSASASQRADDVTRTAPRRRRRDGLGQRLVDDAGAPSPCSSASASPTRRRSSAPTACPTRCSPTPRRPPGAGCGRSSPAPAAPPTCPGCWPPRRRCRCSACPVPSRHLQGQDSLLSIVQMPAGVPVATFAIGEAGATNAALFAVALLAADDADAGRRARRRPRRAPRATRRPPSTLPPPTGVTSDRPAGDDRHARRRPARPLHRRRGPADGLRHDRARPRPGAPAGARRRRAPRRRRTTTRPRSTAWPRRARWSRPSSRTRRRRRSSGSPRDVVVAPVAAAVADRPGPHRPRRRSSPRPASPSRRAPWSTRGRPRGDRASAFPAIVKTARLGYDGKGQRRRRRRRRARRGVADARRRAVRASSSGSPLDVELSVIVARTRRRPHVPSYPVAENHHVDGILDLTVVPARVDAGAGRRGRRRSPCAIAEALDYVGVLAVELFVSGGRAARQRAGARGRTTAATGRSTPPSRASSSSRCGPCAGWRSATDALTAPAVAMVNLLGDLWAGGEPRLGGGARRPGCPAAPLRQGRRPARPQDGPPHGARRRRRRRRRAPRRACWTLTRRPAQHADADEPGRCRR